eukprot:2824359-Ditylum_brightwellii.AAC.1
MEGVTIHMAADVDVAVVGVDTGIHIIKDGNKSPDSLQPYQYSNPTNTTTPHKHTFHHRQGILGHQRNKPHNFLIQVHPHRFNYKIETNQIRTSTSTTTIIVGPM